MPRQTFLSKESFVDATEKQTKATLLSIPGFVSNIQLLSENKTIESLKFSYEQPVKKLQYHIDITILPLNDQYTRISLHASYANGQIFHSNSDMAVVLHDFESAIHAALKGDLSYYKPYAPRPAVSKKFMQLIIAVTSSVGVFFLRKKLS